MVLLIARLNLNSLKVVFEKKNLYPFRKFVLIIAKIPPMPYGILLTNDISKIIQFLFYPFKLAINHSNKTSSFHLLKDYVKMSVLLTMQFDFSSVVLKHVLDDQDLVTVKQNSYVELTSFLFLSARFIKVT